MKYSTLLFIGILLCACGGSQDSPPDYRVEDIEGRSFIVPASSASVVGARVFRFSKWDRVFEILTIDSISSWRITADGSWSMAGDQLRLNHVSGREEMYRVLSTEDDILEMVLEESSQVGDPTIGEIITTLPSALPKADLLSGTLRLTHCTGCYISFLGVGEAMIELGEGATEATWSLTNFGTLLVQAYDASVRAEMFVSTQFGTAGRASLNGYLISDVYGEVRVSATSLTY